MRTVLIGLVVATTAGCGLIDSDITRFDLQVADKEFSVNSADWQLTSDATFPAIDCTGMNVCSTAIAEACGNDAACFGSCDGTNCQALILVSASQDIDLERDRPELNEVAKRPLIEVTVESIVYDIPENTLNVPTPELQVYVAPIAITNPGDPQAVLIGTIQPIPANTTQADKNVVFVTDGELELAEFMGNWKTQFNVIVGSQLTVKAGDPVPQGALKASVTVNAYANL